MKHVLGFSGGIDSQATARWLLNRYAPDDVILLNSDAGGNEHPWTTDFIERYSRDIHPVVMVSPIVADMGTRAKAKREAMGLKDSDSLTFDLMVELKGVFPSRKKQFCTEHLKLYPQQRWIKEHLQGVEFRRYSGVRRQEGKIPGRGRSIKQPVEWDDFFGTELFHPIVDWTKQMCFDFVKHHGEEINPLYSVGFSRVGCAPCVNSGKADVLKWVQRFPEMIDKVREWEKRIGKPFFMPVVPGREINWIDDVVLWSKTLRGGKQYDLLVLEEPPACESSYGLCE